MRIVLSGKRVGRRSVGVEEKEVREREALRDSVER